MKKTLLSLVLATPLLILPGCSNEEPTKFNENGRLVTPYETKRFYFDELSREGNFWKIYFTDNNSELIEKRFSDMHVVFPQISNEDQKKFKFYEGNTSKGVRVIKDLKEGERSYAQVISYEYSKLDNLDINLEKVKRKYVEIHIPKDMKISSKK